MEKINIPEKFKLFDDYWNPRIIAELNGQDVKLAKFKGEFVWHKHDHQDELFMVLRGELTLEFRDRTITLGEHELVVVPRGVEHRPVASEEVHVLLFEPHDTLNTGDAGGEHTRKDLEKI
ncbi:MAG: cupin domain-containing protein [Bacteroidales bacterium]|jgi:mannose-6-phosphate isomerase-like protein (cupin superfamily)|nr:cupin domain-containing protein [Bacteroidales bacterium]